jgi:hypothetical protein
MSLEKLSALPLTRLPIEKNGILSPECRELEIYASEAENV